MSCLSFKCEVCFRISAESSSDSLYSESDLDTYDRPRFEFRNRIVPTHEIRSGSLSRDELHQMIKKLIFEPEGIFLNIDAHSFCSTLINLTEKTFVLHNQTFAVLIFQIIFVV